MVLTHAPLPPVGVRTSPADFSDIAFQPSGTHGYSDLHIGAANAEIYASTVEIASLGDVIRSKQAANRPKDQRVLPTLRDLLAKG